VEEVDRALNIRQSAGRPGVHQDLDFAGSLFLPVSWEVELRNFGFHTNFTEITGHCFRNHPGQGRRDVEIKAIGKTGFSQKLLSTLRIISGWFGAVVAPLLEAEAHGIHLGLLGAARNEIRPDAVSIHRHHQRFADPLVLQRRMS